MTSTTRLVSMIAALCALAWPARAADGVLIVGQSTGGGSVQTTRVQIEPQRMRAEIVETGGGPQVMVFDGVQEVLWVIDESRRTYSEMTRADVERMGSQMNAMMAQMQEQLANLPPAQRAQIEAMMKGRGMAGMPGAATSQPTQYRQAGMDQVGQWPCVVYEGFQGSQQVSELCAVEPEELGFTAGDFAVSRQMAEFFSSLLPESADTMFRLGTPEEQGFSGVPVRTVSLTGQPTTWELVEVSRQTFPDELFTVPAGFERQAMPFGAPGR